MDVSPKQLVSVAAGLIPFLEHDDANRALMGSNMQRQARAAAAAPRRRSWRTGLEARVARDSRAVIVAERRRQGGLRRRPTRSSSPRTARCRRARSSTTRRARYVYQLQQVHALQRRHLHQPEADRHEGREGQEGRGHRRRPGTGDGELALGRNVLVAFMPWNGYNFEDAILISERVVKDDIFTSIHIEEFEVTARDTKLGPEEITRDIPNVGEEALQEPRPRRRHPHRRRGEARRHPRRQDHAEERDRTGARRSGCCAPSSARRPPT